MISLYLCNTHLVLGRGGLQDTREHVLVLAPGGAHEKPMPVYARVGTFQFCKCAGK